MLNNHSAESGISSFHVMGRKPPHIAIFASAWGPSHGGINTLNTDLCSALVAAGCSVDLLCTEEVKFAVPNGLRVTRLSTQSDFSGAQAHHAASALLQSPDLWIGHDLVSGQFALMTKQFTASQAPLAIMFHSHYLSYKTIESNAETAQAKTTEQEAIFKQCQFVIAVGPKLYARASDMIRPIEPKPKLVALIPGLPNIEPLPAPSQFRLFFGGRLSGKSTRLKQLNLGIDAFSLAASESNGPLGNDAILTLLGATADDIKLQVTEAATKANRHLQIHALPFTNDHAALVERLRSETAAMLLSLHEGFGLSGWEAIGAGVPLIISKNSGLFEWLNQEYGGVATGCLLPVTIRGSANPDNPNQEDVAEISSHIKEIARSPERARKNAILLRDQLAQHNWHHVTSRLLTDLGFGAQKLAMAQVRISATAGTAPVPTRDPVPGVTPLSTLPALLPDALFEVYAPRHKQYTSVRAGDEDLEKIIRAKSVWLYGPPGTGKTTSARRATMDSDRRYRYVSFACCEGFSIAALAAHLLSELTDVDPRQFISDSRQAIVARIIDSASEVPTTLHLDELPAESGESYDALVALIAAILAENRQQLLLMVTTLHDPSERLGPLRRHLAERLALLNQAAWNRAELLGLLAIIQPHLPRPLVQDELDLVMSISAATPRFLKECLRKALIFHGNTRWPIERIVSETRLEVLT